MNKRYLEKNRWSILYNDLTKCAICGTTFGIEKNEVFEGAKRNNSMIYGFVIPLCQYHHRLFHNNRDFSLPIKQRFQKEFLKTHSLDDFLSIIHRNYL